MRWCDPVLAAVAAQGAGSYIVAFPAYRPDLIEELATALGCAFVDFRKDYMAPLGMQAHRLDIGTIEVCAAERANDAGLMLHNAESLLAARTPAERTEYLAQFLGVERENIAVLPLSLFGPDVGDHPRVIRLARADLPEETMLRQLASMRFQ